MKRKIDIDGNPDGCTRRIRIAGCRGTIWLPVVALLLGSGCASAPRQDGTFGNLAQTSALVATGERTLRARMHGWHDLRFQRVVPQRLDYSCGSAALATLMTYGFDDPRDEFDIIDTMLEQMSEAEIEDRITSGFTLLDLKRCAEHFGYSAVGARMPPETLAQIDGPVIVHLDTDGYLHFVVLSGVRGGRAWIADPAEGETSIPFDRFLRSWTGVVLALGRRGVPPTRFNVLHEGGPAEALEELNPARLMRYR